MSDNNPDQHNPPNQQHNINLNLNETAPNILRTISEDILITFSRFVI